jgi:hypothetical protein
VANVEEQCSLARKYALQLRQGACRSTHGNNEGFDGDGLTAERRAEDGREHAPAELDAVTMAVALEREGFVGDD